MRKRLSAERFGVLMDKFDNEIFVWMCENRKSLHDTFEYARENNPDYYAVLSELWSDLAGKEYIRSKMRKCGNKPTPKHLGGKYGNV